MAHDFHTAGDAHIDAATLDESIDQMIRLLTGSALRVNGRGTAGVVVAGGKPCMTNDVIRLLPRLGHTPADHLFDLRRWQIISLTDRRLNLAQQVSRMNPGQIALDHLPPCDGRTNGIDDHCFNHGHGCYALFSFPDYAGLESPRMRPAASLIRSMILLWV